MTQINKKRLILMRFKTFMETNFNKTNNFGCFRIFRVISAEFLRKIFVFGTEFYTFAFYVKRIRIGTQGV